MNQLSFSSYVDNVASVYNDTHITNICKLIDQKQNKGLKCNDLKVWLLGSLAARNDLTQTPCRKIYKDAFSFIENDLNQ